MYQISKDTARRIIGERALNRLRDGAHAIGGTGKASEAIPNNTATMTATKFDEGKRCRYWVDQPVSSLAPRK